MAFKEVMDLDCDNTTALGGHNKKTGKANPTRVEGYYIGSKETPSKKTKSGIAMLHILQTAKGNLGVWGKTDLDRKLRGAPIGAMIRITQSGTVPTPNGDMYKFKVEVDEDNSIEVNFPQAQDGQEEEAESSESSESGEEEGYEETDVDADEVQPDEVKPARATPPRQAAAPSLSQRDAVLARLNARKASATK